MEIYFFILRFVDSVTIFPYMLTYMYWDTNIVHAIILLYIFIIVNKQTGILKMKIKSK